MKAVPLSKTPPPVLRIRRLPEFSLRAPIELRQGEMLAAHIASRAAREALLARLSGDAPAEAGAIMLLGRDLAGSPHLPRPGVPPVVTFVPRDGGLFANLNVWENIWTPVTYHRPDTEADLAWRVHTLLDQLALDAPRTAARRPAELNALERRLVGFVRAVALEPELVVIESLFEDLDAAENKQAARVFDVFHRFLPFRSLLVVGAHFPPEAEHPQLRFIRAAGE